METTFIYALCEPNSRTVRYIGKANNPSSRFKQHLASSVKRDTYLGNWLRSVLAVGQTPSLVVLREVPFSQWEIAEERYIRLARGLGMSVTNATDGGEGQVNPTPETRFKIGSAQRGKTGEKSPFFGRKHRPESNELNRVAHLGRSCSPETREALRKTSTGRERSPETCKLISASKRGPKNPMFGKSPAPRSPEVLKAMSVLNSGSGNPNFGKKPSPETTAKRRASLKAFYARKAAQKAAQV